MNKIVKRILALTLIAALAVAVAIIQPWKYFALLPIVNSGTALTVNTSGGKAEVYLNGKKVGETPFSSENLPAGEHTLEIRRISLEPDFYNTIRKQIHLEANTRTFVEAEIGPGEQFSSTHVMYYRNNNTTDASIYVDASPDNCTVTIDDVRSGETPVTNNSLSPGKHTLRIEHDGYEPQETVIIIREGFTLIAEFQLMSKPIELTAQ